MPQKSPAGFRRATIALCMSLLLCFCGGCTNQTNEAPSPTAAVSIPQEDDDRLPVDTLLFQPASVNGQPPQSIRAFYDDYVNNLYISLRDAASLFADTLPFTVKITANDTLLTTGTASTEPIGTASFSLAGVSARQQDITVDGQTKKYFLATVKDGQNRYDAFIAAVDLSMLLKIGVNFANGVLSFDTGKPFLPDMEQLKKENFFENVNAAVAANVTTGESFFAYHEDISFPIASTTKLMTYLLVTEAVDAGTLSLSDPLTVSEKAAALSQSDDGVVRLKPGQQADIRELLYAMLLSSSNECALVLAEAVSGSEDAFVLLMQQRARELGMDDTVFFNCHGLPVYTKTTVPGKSQNRASAADMLKLVTHLLKAFPAVKSITGTKEKELKGLGYTAVNSNPLLWNVPEATGLKTGTTNRAGYCLITSVEVNGEDRVVILLGAETAADRNRKSEISARLIASA